MAILGFRRASGLCPLAALVENRAIVSGILQQLIGTWGGSTSALKDFLSDPHLLDPERTTRGGIIRIWLESGGGAGHLGPQVSRKL